MGTIAKTVSSIVGAITIVSALYAGLATLGYLPVSQNLFWSWIRPMTCQILQVRQHVDIVDLWNWEHNNPEPHTQQVQENIDSLRTKVQQLNLQIQQWNC
jgi:hypothetical protein